MTFLRADRPDITSIVFKARLDAMLANIHNGRYFNTNKVMYEIRVIEYQNRGM